MSGRHITNQKDLRREFWATAGHGLPHRKTVKFGDERHYPTDTRVAFVDYVDAMQKGGEIDEDLASRATLGGFGEQPLTVQNAVPTLVGAGSAAVVTAGVRGLAPAGTWPMRHAGAIGAFGGMIIALLTKQGGAGVAGAVLVGLAVEGIEALTKVRMTAKE